MMRNSNNGKYKCVKPEDVRTGVAYAFSFNPENQPTVATFGKMTLTAFSEWSEEIYKMFTRLQYCKLTTFMEISSGGRLHFHGKIVFIDIIKFFYFDLKILKFHGSYEIDTINTSDEKWQEYCLKLQSPMSKFCKEYGMDQFYDTNINTKTPKQKTKCKIIDQ